METPFNRENMSQWDLTTHPARTVIDAGMQKTFQVQYQPLDEKSAFTKDRVYKIAFVPTPYTPAGETQASVSFAIGFAPFFIVPAKEDRPIKFELTHQGAQLELINHGETYVRAYIDGCQGDEKDRNHCENLMYAVSGRHLTIPLTESMQDAPRIKLHLTTNQGKYKKDIQIKSGQHLTS